MAEMHRASPYHLFGTYCEMESAMQAFEKCECRNCCSSESSSGTRMLLILCFVFVCSGWMWPVPQVALAAGGAGWWESTADIVWVAYTPPSGNPNEGIEATAEAIRGDLRSCSGRTTISILL